MCPFFQKLALFSVGVAALFLGSYAIHQKVQGAATATAVPLSKSTTEAALAATSTVAAPGSTIASRGSHFPISMVRKPAVQAAALLAQTTYFERNDGQTDPQVLFVSHGAAYTLFLTRTGLTMVLPGSRKRAHATPATKPDFLGLEFAGASLQPHVEGIDRLPGISNYFGGPDPKLWHTRIPQFAKVRYSGLYPGVDLIFYFRDGHLEYDIDAAPNANLGAVHFKTVRANPRLTPRGDVVLRSANRRTVKLAKPYAHQDDRGPTPLRAAYELHGNDVSFAFGQYDHGQRVVIDPALIFSTYLNSNCPLTPPIDSCVDTVTDIAADTTGVYVTGSTQAASFPATTGNVFQGPQSKSFVLKISPDGSNIIFVSYLVSSYGLSIAVDPGGSPYVVGEAYVGFPGLPPIPLTQGAFSGVIPASAQDSQTLLPYATKFSADGSTLEYSTLLQQPGASSTRSSVMPAKVAVDSTGALYVTGTSVANNAGASDWLPLPTSVGAFQTNPGLLFVLKLNATGSGVGYSTYIDANSSAGIAAPATTGIAVNFNGNAFVTGTTGAGFPTTTGAYETTSQNGGAFVTELNPTGTAQVYSTYFNSTSSQPGILDSFGIAIDPSDEAVIVGSGFSPPVTSNAFCMASSNGFITKFNSTGSGLVYSTTLCGGEGDAVAVDSTGAAYVTGWSDPTAFGAIVLQPIQSYPAPPAPPGTQPSAAQAIALKLNAAGTPIWATFLGLTQETPSIPTIPPSRIVIDSNLDAYILYGPATEFPTTPNAVGLTTPGTSHNAGDNFLLKIAPGLGAAVPLASPTSVSFPGENIGVSSAAVDVQLGNYGDASASPALSLTGDFSQTNDCSSGVPAGSKCDVNVVFTPTTVGARNGVLTFTFGGSVTPVTVPLTGTGTAPAVMLSPTSLSFGVQATGTTSAAQQVTLTNSGTSQLSIVSIQTTAQFAATNSCGQAIAPTNNCTISVTFTPTASGVQTGTLTITDNASNSPQTVSLSGNQPAGFTITPGGGSSSTSATVTAGQTASYSLNLTGTNGFTGAVSFTRAGAPSYSTCTVSPNPANLSGTSAMPVSVSVSTQSGSDTVPLGIRLPNIPTQKELLLATSAALMFVSFLFIGRGAASGKRIFAGAALLLATLVVAAGCGGGSYTPPKQNKTPSGQYTLTITATSGSVTQSTNLNLTVN